MYLLNVLVALVFIIPAEILIWELFLGNLHKQKFDASSL